MRHYPIVLLPPALELALTGELRPQPFTMAQPQVLAAPKRWDPVMLGIQAGGVAIVAGIPWWLNLGPIPPLWISAGILGLGAAAVGAQIWQSQRSYPARFKAYERSLIAAQAYRQAKRRHQELQDKLKTPEGMADYRREQVKEILKKAHMPDGRHTDLPPQGQSEAYFFQQISSYFPEQVGKEPYLDQDHSDRPFTPDTTLFDANYHLLMDIEIDEPYVFETRKPYHVAGSDDHRDQHFLSKGWVVVRFAEKQVVDSVESCIKTVAKVIAEITGDDRYLQPLLDQGIPDLEPMSTWTEAQARQWAFQNYRGTYLEKLPKVDPPKPPPSKPSKPFVPSGYQVAIFDFIENGSGDGLVEAVAGSGKSTTLVQAVRRLKTKNGVFLAFNKSIAQELGRKLGSQMSATTIHSLGMSIVRNGLGQNIKVDGFKYGNLIKKLLSNTQKAWKEQQKPLPRIWQQLPKLMEELVKLSRLTLTDPQDRNALAALADHYNIKIKEPDLALVGSLLGELLALGRTEAEDNLVIDFDDQLWLPLVLNLETPKYDFIFCDECQDLNPAQLELVLKCKSKQGRILFVGDQAQAIYGFAGADCDSINKIVARTNATRLPLSICYRCPSSHIEQAKELVPQIEPRPNAPEGIIGKVREIDLPKLLAPGDMVICRTKAPLMKVWLRLLRNGIPVLNMADERKPGDMLVDILNQVARTPDFNFQRLIRHLNQYQREWQHKQGSKPILTDTERIEAEDREEIEKSKIEALQSLYRISQSNDLDSFCDEIKAKFNIQKGGVILCSGHKSKGLEADRVFLLRPDLMPYKVAGEKEWNQQQEWNLRYVALTRAKQEFYFVEQ